MRKLLFSVVILACAATFSYAQSDYNKVDIYAGYSHARVDFGDFEFEGFNGVEGAVTGNISRYIGLKGDYAYHFKSFDVVNIDVDAKTHTLVGGVQFKDNSKDTRIKPFGHLMAGFTHAKVDVDPVACAAVIGAPCPFGTSETGFAGVIGGGVDIKLSPRVDVRAIQFDYNPTRLGGETQHNFRIGVGLVFR